MSFDVNTGTMVDLNDAAQWTRAYRESPSFDGNKSMFYGKNKINDLLNQENCVGIRIYKAIDENGEPVMVLIGTDAEGNDLLGGYVLERGQPCPNNCGGGGGIPNPLQ